jgi:hypothetical protein
VRLDSNDYSVDPAVIVIDDVATSPFEAGAANLFFQLGRPLITPLL